MVINIVAIIIGTIACLFGYKVVRIWLALAGLLLGAALGYYLGGLIGGQIWPIVGAIAIGLVICLLSYFLYRVGAVLIGALLGAAFTSVILTALNVAVLPWMLLVGAVLVAVIAGVFLKEFIIIGSSFQGAYMIVAGVYALVTGISYVGFEAGMRAVELPWFIIAIIALLGIVAVVIQNKIEKNNPPKQAQA
ncbi:MAG TPA: DUF4203 domain-containing protein [Negativicutes bacterium]|nr:DUF4203 domain-containing protein [Negativicutes bacterium]